MSGGHYERDEIYIQKGYTEAAEEEFTKLLRVRAARVTAARGEVETKAARGQRPTRDPREGYDPNFVRGSITRPAVGVDRVHVVLIDNSGSNRLIANHFRRSTNYLRVNLGLIDPGAQFAFVYFSDHCDQNLWSQPIDFVHPSDEGEKIVTSTLYHIKDVNGGDEPEAHECALWDACQINFGEAKKRHLILISDVTGHSMGMREDDGCPQGRSWQDSLDLVERTYQSFEMIGCGDAADVALLQGQFIEHAHPERLAANFLSLAHIPDHKYRLGMVLNAFLFLVARSRGMQSLEGFLSRLYEKWIDDPIFGGDTDQKAKEAILRFTGYIPGQMEDKIQMMIRVLVTTPEEIKILLGEGALFM